MGCLMGDTLVPRTTGCWKAPYRTLTAVEREFGNLKNNWALTPLRVRRIERVLHADLTILARLSTALANARAAVPLAAYPYKVTNPARPVGPSACPEPPRAVAGASRPPERDQPLRIET
jgi:hypothetical protein